MTVNYNTYKEEKMAFFNKTYILKMVLSGMKQCHLSM